MEVRTNIVLDEELVEKAMAKAGVATKRAAVETALRDYVREPDWKGLLDLEGSRAVADEYDSTRLFERDRAPSEARQGRRSSGETTSRAVKKTSRKTSMRRR